VEDLHSSARRSLASRQVITGDDLPGDGDLPGGIWRHGATLSVRRLSVDPNSIGWWRGVVGNASRMRRSYFTLGPVST